MTIRLMFLSAFCCLLFSCNEKKLNPNYLPIYSFQLNADSAYALKTPHGAIIKIPDHCFDVPAHTKLNLEIREAFSIQDILLGGLQTKSNGNTLQSGGMIYVEVSDSLKEVKYLKKVGITIPSPVFDPKMQLYKGEIKGDSSLNWVDPTPLKPNPLSEDIVAGKALFKANCANCHHPSKNFTAPLLAGCRNREPNKEWAYKFVDNTNVMVETDPYANQLMRKFGSKMTQFQLKAKEIKSILYYCDNEGLLHPEDVDYVNSPHIDSLGRFNCGKDTFYYPKPAEDIESIDISKTADSAIDNYENEFEEKGLKYVQPDPGLYSFEIDQNGWYNVDHLLDDRTNIVNLLAQLIYKDSAPDMHVFLCIPDKKILMEAIYHKGNEYVFKEADGSIPLILNDSAFIFAMGGDKGENMLFGIQPFAVTLKQVIPVKLELSTKEKILKGIKENQLNDIKIDIKKKEKLIIDKPCIQDLPGVAIPIANN